MPKKTTPDQYGTPQTPGLTQGEVLSIAAMAEVKASMEAVRHEICELRSEINRKEDKIDARIDKLEKKLEGKIDTLEGKVTVVRNWMIGVSAAAIAVAGFVGVIYSLLSGLIGPLLEAIGSK